MSLHVLLTAAYLYFPGALANVGAVVSRFIPGFNTITKPADFGLSFRRKRLVGDHKTVGGVLFGIFLGTLVGSLKFILLDPLLPELVLLNLNFLQNLFLYFLISAGAVYGDLIKSALKRQFGIKPHAAWIPFDEIDHSTTALILAQLFFPLPWQIIFIAIALYFFGHILANIIGYLLKIKSVPY